MSNLKLHAKRSGLVLALLLALPAAAAWAQDVCKPHYHSAQGVSARPWQANQFAIKNWQAQVAAHDGKAWAGWVLACNKHVTCRPTGWAHVTRCTAVGRPGTLR